LQPTDNSPEATSRSLAGSAGAQLAALVRLLSPNVEPGSAGSPDAGRQVLTSAFTQLIAQYAVRECLVLLIDSQQWIDAESLAVLDAALPDLEDARLVVISTARPGWQHAWPNPVHALRLERFSRKECAQLMSFLLRADAVAAETLDVLARESGGNPLLLAEMVRSGAETGALAETGGQWRLVRRDAFAGSGNVDSLRGIVQARLDQLSAGERRLLQIAAVFGESYTASLLARVLDDNLPIPDLLRALAEREYLVGKWAMKSLATASPMALCKRLRMPACRRHTASGSTSPSAASWRDSSIPLIRTRRCCDSSFITSYAARAAIAPLSI
jgi:hypothetical protein